MGGQFENAKRDLVAALGDLVAGVHHIGITAVPGLVAKCTIDLALEVRSIGEFLDAIPPRGIGPRVPTHLLLRRRARASPPRLQAATRHIDGSARGYQPGFA